MSGQLYDVLEVDIYTRKITLMGESLGFNNAAAIERMAQLRRATEDNFFVTVPAGKYKEGGTYHD